jgi:hypothetical protein
MKSLLESTRQQTEKVRCQTRIIPIDCKITDQNCYQILTDYEFVNSEWLLLKLP